MRSVGEGYAATTITGGPQEDTRVSVHLYMDEQAWIAVCGQEKDRPQLSVHYGQVTVTIAPILEPASAGDARLARELATAAACYAAEVERVHAAQQVASPAA